MYCTLRYITTRVTRIHTRVIIIERYTSCQRSAYNYARVCHCVLANRNGDVKTFFFHDNWMRDIGLRIAMEASAVRLIYKTFFCILLQLRSAADMKKKSHFFSFKNGKIRLGGSVNQLIKKTRPKVEIIHDPGVDSKF